MWVGGNDWWQFETTGKSWRWRDVKWQRQKVDGGDRQMERR